VYFNLSNGTVGTQAFGSTGSIQNAGNGWYRCTVTRNAPGGTYFSALEVHTANNQALSWTAAGTETILVWGADLRPTSQATGLIGPTYQRVAAATDYDTVGFLPYLAFDGVDDSMSTGSIDFTATDKMTVWAGVRKLSDAAQSAITCVGDVATNAGSLEFGGSASAAANYILTLRGSSSLGQWTYTTYSAPVSNVISSGLDLSNTSGAGANKTSTRINGVANAGTWSTGNAGTGNFGNYPLFIGQRNNTSLPFNGWLSSLIIRGAQSTDSQISATESWVNGRTGAY
jgi:hypothetical protein